MIFRVLPATLLACFSAIAHAQAPARCTAMPPANWASSIRWDGPCRDGIANGSGALKEMNGSTIRRLFFGEVKNGTLQYGVIDTGDGYIAGHFDHGNAVQNEDRQIVIAAFDKAATAADEAAQRYEKAGNQASAKFYRAKAKAMREQMD